MPVTLTIIADNAAALVQEFRMFNAETAGPSENPLTTLSNVPLDALIDMVRERLRDDGFKLEIIDQRDQSPPPDGAPEAQLEAAAEPEPAPKTRGRPRKANGATTPEVVTEPSTTLDDEDITRPKKPSKSKPLVVLDETLPEPDPTADKLRVIDTLGNMLRDPEAKDRVLTFASTMAKKHGKDKLMELPDEPFSEIRLAMEKEFPNA